MKKHLFKTLLSVIFIFLSFAVLAATPSINQYRIEKHPVLTEPAPSQYTISYQDRVKTKKPPFSYYTQFNRFRPNAIYTIPPFPYAQQLPKIGKWMIAPHKNGKKVAYVPSHWLNYQSASGKYIIEPINYVFIVFSHHENKAVSLLKRAMVKAGFTMKWSGAKYHSGNYHVYLGDQMLPQLKRKDGVFITFSNQSWLHQNDHLRIMGPFKTTINNKTAFIFASSVSEETAWDEKLYAGHFYVSFTHARSNLASALIENGYPTYYVLSNNLLNNAKETTEDHDGKVFITTFQ